MLLLLGASMGLLGLTADLVVTLSKSGVEVDPADL